MKHTSNYSKLFKGTVLLAMIAFFASCKKNDVNPTEMFNIKVVNASPNSGPQSFTLAGKVLVSGGLDFTESSAYISTNSGTRLVEEFKQEGTNTVSATGELWTDDGVSFTVYLAGEGNDARVKSFEDNLSAPPSGKARVKFIHLSDGAPSDINIKNAAGDNLVTNISRNIASGYSNVDPGTLSIKIYGTASRDNIGNFDIADLQAGKIYSIYLTGADNASLTVHKVLHN